MEKKKRARHHNAQPFIRDDDSIASTNKRTKASKNHQKQENMISSGLSSKILKEALMQQKEIQEEAEVTNPTGIAFALAEEENARDQKEDEEEDLDDFNGFSETETQFGDYDDIDENEEKLLEAFLSKDAGPQRTLADLIMEKIKQKDLNVSSEAPPLPKLDESIIGLCEGSTSVKMKSLFKKAARTEALVGRRNRDDESPHSSSASLQAQSLTGAVGGGEPSNPPHSRAVDISRMPHFPAGSTKGRGRGSSIGGLRHGQPVPVCFDEAHHVYRDTYKLKYGLLQAPEELQEGTSSEPRHIRRRCVSGSVRGERAEQRQQLNAVGEVGEAHVVDAEVEEEGPAAHDRVEEDYVEEGYTDRGDDRDDYEAHVSSADDSDSVVECRVVKGRGGRFVSAASTSGSMKRSRAAVDESWKVTGPVPGGPEDGSVIPSFLGHVASQMWGGQMRGVLTLHNRLTHSVKLRKWYRETTDEVRALVDGTGLSHLPFTMFRHVDTPLICAFVERWQPDTSSFHMPFGEMTIMLHDVWHILRIPVDGHMISTDLGIDELQTICMEVLGVSMDVLSDVHWSRGSVSFDSIMAQCRHGRFQDTEATAWIWLVLGCTLFVDKSGNRVRPACMTELRDGLEHTHTHSWGSATLAYLYRQLGQASRGDCQGLAGCLTLLQAWIYEYFPCFRPQREPMGVPAESPRAAMWHDQVHDRSDARLQSLRARIDQLTASEVMWLPYGADPASSVMRTAFTGWVRYRDVIEPYMPGRALRQLGFVQNIPAAITRPVKEVRSWSNLSYKVEHPVVTASDAWIMFPNNYMLPFSRYRAVSLDPSACERGYIDWYNHCSHPRLLSGSGSSSSAAHSRSNSEYWVTRMTSMYIDLYTLAMEYDEDETKPHAERLEQFMSDWHKAK